MGLESCHPIVNVIFYIAVFLGSAMFQHPVFLMFSFLGAAAYSVRRCGRNAGRLILCACGLMGISTVLYAGTHHFGVTVLLPDFLGNVWTAESICYGLSLGVRIAAVLLWLESMFQVISSDQIIHLLGKIHPILILPFTVLFRWLPNCRRQMRKIHHARAGIGKGIHQGTLREQLQNLSSFVSVRITWSIQYFADSAHSIRTRGGGLPGRTAFSMYRFDQRDRGLMIAVFFGITCALMGIILETVYMTYAPSMIWKPLHGVELLTALGYGFLCFLPTGFELGNAYFFAKAYKRSSRTNR